MISSDTDGESLVRRDESTVKNSKDWRIPEVISVAVATKTVLTQRDRSIVTSKQLGKLEAASIVLNSKANLSQSKKS
jgi:hypothetical protein